MMGDRRSRRVVAVVGAVAIGAIGLVACGGGSNDNQARVLEAGQVDVKLPEGFKVVNQKAVVVKKKNVAAPKPADSKRTTATTKVGSTPTAPPGQGTTPTTEKNSVPLDKNSNPTDDLLASFGKFRDCPTAST